MTDAHTPQVDIAALANLARLEITPEEIATLEKEIPDILAFVKTIQEASVEAPAADTSLRNVMRDDTDPYEGGAFTESILSAAPERKGDHIVVKQVISRKK